MLSSSIEKTKVSTYFRFEASKWIFNGIRWNEEFFIFYKKKLQKDGASQPTGKESQKYGFRQWIQSHQEVRRKWYDWSQAIRGRKRIGNSQGEVASQENTRRGWVFLETGKCTRGNIMGRMKWVWVSEVVKKQEANEWMKSAECAKEKKGRCEVVK